MKQQQQQQQLILVLDCFVCATSDGIRVFNVEPFAQKCYLGRELCFFFLCFAFYLQ